MYLVTSQENFYLAENIVKYSHLIHIKPNCLVFPSGEMIFEFSENLENEIVYYIFYLPSQIGEELFKTLLVIDSLKRCGVHEIILIISYLPYLRQNYLESNNASYGCKVVSNILENSGVDKILILQPHFPQINGFFKINIQQILITDFLTKFIRNKISDDQFVVISTDFGAYKNCKSVADSLNLDLVLIEKLRIDRGKNLKIKLNYDLKGKHCLILDDMIDTGQTLFKLSELLEMSGATQITAYICHLLFPEKILDKIDDFPLKKLYAANSIPHNIVHPKIEFMDISEVILDYIKKT